MKLKNAPLVEAIVEVHWSVDAGAAPDQGFGMKYNLIPGTLAESLKGEYPFSEAMPGASFPVEMAQQMGLIQYRFRVKEGGWPLVQLGPGIFTVNETEGYDWDSDFKKRSVSAVELLFEACRTRDVRIKTESLLLRYIDGIPFDWKSENLSGFMKSHLKTEVKLPDSLFDETGVEDKPQGMDLRCSYNCASPKGLAHLRFASGECRGAEAVIMETMVQSLGADVPSMPSGFRSWLEAAHNVPSTWFKRLAAGDLMARFEHG